MLLHVVLLLHQQLLQSLTCLHAHSHCSIPRLLAACGMRRNDCAMCEAENIAVLKHALECCTPAWHALHIAGTSVQA